MNKQSIIKKQVQKTLPEQRSQRALSLPELPFKQMLSKPPVRLPSLLAMQPQVKLADIADVEAATLRDDTYPQLKAIRERIEKRDELKELLTKDVDAAIQEVYAGLHMKLQRLKSLYEKEIIYLEKQTQRKTNEYLASFEKKFDSATQRYDDELKHAMASQEKSEKYLSQVKESIKSVLDYNRAIAKKLLVFDDSILQIEKMNVRLVKLEAQMHDESADEQKQDGSISHIQRELHLLRSQVKELASHHHEFKEHMKKETSSLREIAAEFKRFVQQDRGMVQTFAQQQQQSQQSLKKELLQMENKLYLTKTKVDALFRSRSRR